MTHALTCAFRTLLIRGSILFIVAGCASNSGPQTTTAPTATPAAAATTPAAELPAPSKPILVFDADTNRPYEILGDVEATQVDQRIYNYEGSRDQARELLKRVAYAKFGDRLDAIINYRVATVVGGGGFWGAVGAAYGARNSDVKASGVAVRFKSSGQSSAAGAANVAAAPSQQNRAQGKGDAPTHAVPAPNAGTQASGVSPAADKGIGTAPSRESIARAQVRLNELKFNVGQADGQIGARTKDAIRKFQAGNGLAQTGMLDIETLTALGIR